MSNPRDLGDRKAQNLNIFLKVREGERLEMWSLAYIYRVHLVQVCRLFDAQDLPERWLWSSGRVFPSFCPLSRFVFGALSLNVALFRVLRAFLAWFVVSVWVCVVLVLCVACVAFVRVWS